MKNSNLNITFNNIDETKIADAVQRIKYDVDQSMLGSKLSGKHRSAEWHRRYTSLLETRVRINNIPKSDNWLKRFFREVCFIKP